VPNTSASVGSEQASEGNVPIQEFTELHKQAGLRFSWGLGSGGSDITKLIEPAGKSQPPALCWLLKVLTSRTIGASPIRARWAAKIVRGWPWQNCRAILYQAVKSDPVLRNYPVWSISEGGAETDNVGLQFLRVPKGGDTLMAGGTQYADYANAHNYIYHPNASGLEDNKTWKAADPTSACKVDGLYVEYGLTWAHHLPRLF